MRKSAPPHIPRGRWRHTGGQGKTLVRLVVLVCMKKIVEGKASKKQVKAQGKEK